MASSVGSFDVMIEFKSNINQIQKDIQDIGKTSKSLSTTMASSFKKSTASMNSGFNAVGNTVKKLGNTIKAAFSITGILLLISKMKSLVTTTLDAGSALVEVQNVVDVTFGESSKVIDEFAKRTKDAFGLSELSAKEFASVFGATFKASGITSTAVLAEMSTQMSALVGDVASFRNMSPEEVFDKFTSGITGNIKAMRSLGVSMTIVNLENFAMTNGINKSWLAMSSAEQQALRYAYMMTVLKDSVGDFTKTQDTWANQTRLLSQNLVMLKTIIGSVITQAFAPFIKVLNFIVVKVAAFATVIANALGFGSSLAKDVSNINSAISGVGDNGTLDDLGDSASESSSSVQDLNDSLKKTSKTLASFDEVITLNADTSSDTSSSSTPDYGNLSDIKDTFSTGLGDDFLGLLDSVSTYDFGSFGDSFAIEVAEMKKRLEDFYIKFHIEDIVGFIQEKISIIKTIVENIPIGFSTNIDNILGDLQPLLDNITSINESIGTILFGDMSPEEIGTSLGNISGNLADIVIIIADVVTEPIAELLEIMATNTDDGLLKTIENITDYLTGDGEEGFRTFLETVLELTVAMILLKAAFTISKGITTLVGILGTLGTVIGTVTGLFSSGGALAGVGSAIATALTGPVGIVLAIIALVGILGVLIYKNWDAIKAFGSDVGDKIGSTFDSIKTKFSEFISGNEELSSGMAKLTDGISENFTAIKNTVTEWVQDVQAEISEFFGKIEEAYEEHIKPAVDRFKEAFTSLYEESIKPFIDKLTELKDKFAEVATALFDKFIAPVLNWLTNTFLKGFNYVLSKLITIAMDIKNDFIDPIVGFFIDTLATAIGNVIDTITSYFTNLVAGLLAIATNIIDIFIGIIDFFINIFSGDMEGAANSILGIFDSLFNAIGGAVSIPVNFVVDNFNNLFQGLADWKIPDFVPIVGGKSFGVIQIPRMPTFNSGSSTKISGNTANVGRLAEGGIVSAATRFIAGEAGAEAIIPLQNSGFIKDFASMIANAVGGNNQSKSEVIINAENFFATDENMRNLFNMFTDYINSENDRTGGRAYGV